MKCKKCGGCMVIDEWDGWRWFCFYCDIPGRRATDAEIKKMEDRQNGKR